MPRAEVDGVTSLSLRGVNWLGEYDQSRPFARLGRKWWHVPTVKFAFGSGFKTPGIEETLDTALTLASHQWPALTAAHIAGVDQDTTGFLGGHTFSGRPEPVTRIALDFGKIDALPEVKFLPHQKLGFPRHPVTWVPGSSIQMVSLANAGKNFPTILLGADQQTTYKINGTQHVVIETKTGPHHETATELTFQGSVAEHFLRSFAESFSPTLRAKGNRLGLDLPKPAHDLRPG